MPPLLLAVYIKIIVISNGYMHRFPRRAVCRRGRNSFPALGPPPKAAVKSLYIHFREKKTVRLPAEEVRGATPLSCPVFPDMGADGPYPPHHSGCGGYGHPHGRLTAVPAVRRESFSGNGGFFPAASASQGSGRQSSSLRRAWGVRLAEREMRRPLLRMITPLAASVPS